jgi:RNA polymerase sigma factor for flagellar operon FliA
MMLGYKTDMDIDEVWRRYAEKRGQAERNVLVTYYMDLVKSIVFKLVPSYGKFVDIDDMMSCGVIGLIDAVTKFDIHKGINFKTYAGYRIKGEIIDFLRKQDFIPANTRAKIKKVEAAYALIESETGKPATEEEVRKYLQMDEKEFREVLEGAYTYNILNIDSILEMAGLEPEEDDEEYIPEESYESKELKQNLAEAIDQLTERERLVITLYYYEELTLKEIGAVLDVSESRVSQIHSAALFKLRKKLK